MKILFRILPFCIALSLLVGCKDDDGGDLTPSMLDVNWYVVQDSSDPVDHKIYEIFKDYKVPIFYNDTIGSQVRGTAVNGDPIMFYKIVDLGYWIETRKTPLHIRLNKNYLYNDDKSQVKAAVDLIETYVMPKLPEAWRPLSILLVDSLFNGASADVRGQHCVASFRGLTTTVMANVKDIPTMSEIEKRHLAGYLLSAMYLYEIKASDRQDYFDTFFDLTVKHTDGTTKYGKTVGSTSNYASSPIAASLWWWNYGFLRHDTERLVYLVKTLTGVNYDLTQMDTKLSGYYCPTMDQDMYEYMAAVLVDDDAWFDATYGKTEVVKNKYAEMKRLLNAYLNAL